MHLLIKRTYLLGIFLIIFGGTLLAWKGPGLIKNQAQRSLERTLAPLGIKEVEIDALKLGWGKLYLQGIHSKELPELPSFVAQEINIALSVLLNIKTIEVVGATLEFKQGGTIDWPKLNWQEKFKHAGDILQQLRQLRLPSILAHDCLLVIPTSQGTLNLPFHATTEITVQKKQVMTLDWGEEDSPHFHGQVVFEADRTGITFDIHTANVNMDTPNFQIKAPEISLWGSTVEDKEENYKMTGFAKLDRMALPNHGTLNMPLEVNLEAAGTAEDITLDGLTVVGQDKESNLLEMEGSLQPYEASGKLVVTSHIPHLAAVWDFSHWDKVDGQLTIEGEIAWKEGALLPSRLVAEVKEGHLSREGTKIKGLASHLTFDSLVPLRTKEAQKIQADTITFAGIDFTNPVLDFLFDDKGFLQIQKFSSELLSGKLIANAFQRNAKVPHLSFQFDTNFENIELADVLKLTNLSSLSGHAKLSGRTIFIYDQQDGIDVKKAELHSVSESGVIQYKSPPKGSKGAVNQKEVNMAFEVLNDFHFTLFTVQIAHTSENSQEMQAIVKLVGSNPSVLNGYPFEFNIVTTGQLKDLVMNTLEHMVPTGDIKKLEKAAKATKKVKKKRKRRNVPNA